PAVGAARATGAAGPDAADDVPGHPGVPGAAPVGHPFAGRDFIVKATLLSASGRRTYLFAVRGQDGSEFTLTDRDLTDTGYAVVPRGNCAAELSFKGGWSGYAACAGLSALGNAPPAQTAAPNVPPAAANGAAVRVTVVPDTSRLPRSIN
ncbi:TPA: zonular occludens toxin domain-containing protein, partial [Pseudomonas aeruginosa]